MKEQKRVEEKRRETAAKKKKKQILRMSMVALIPCKQRILSYYSQKFIHEFIYIS